MNQNRLLVGAAIVALAASLALAFALTPPDTTTGSIDVVEGKHGWRAAYVGTRDEQEVDCEGSAIGRIGEDNVCYVSPMAIMLTPQGELFVDSSTAVWHTPDSTRTLLLGRCDDGELAIVGGQSDAQYYWLGVAYPQEGYVPLLESCG